ncbi:LysM domain-containing protein [Desulfotomaculum arcticum]|uniref:LysM domain-containing protein n=1 Tax=Desulfotruncus arcticus DSM 17038 TaxID=1121424 RepID=A0A1I2YI87_9FIRM|nr:cell wall hydrolase [Desulfotruncus arcticus]SFH25320.1 LysM domain-containing protein [Desulfotomaculum arcticum] [Desulfotruncus arcticus DSM 17038]
MLRISFCAIGLMLMLSVFCFSGVAIASVASRNGQAVYSVVAGDNLYSIGLKYSVTSAELMRANGLDSTLIKPGQKLVIPASRAATGHQVSRGGIEREKLDLLARLIHAEASIEQYQAKVAVGAVVINRVKSLQFPNSIRQVIYQTNGETYQFTPVYNGSINRPAGIDSIRAAKEALSGADPTNGALFFFESDVNNKQLRSRKISTIIDHLTFAY